MTSSQEISEESIYLMAQANLFLESQEHRAIISLFSLTFWETIQQRRFTANASKLFHDASYLNVKWKIKRLKYRISKIKIICKR